MNEYQFYLGGVITRLSDVKVTGTANAESELYAFALGLKHGAAIQASPHSAISCIVSLKELNKVVDAAMGRGIDE